MRIAISIAAWMVNSRLNAAEAASIAAAEFDYYQQLTEAQIWPIALELGATTSTPYWEWFNILRSVQKLGAPGNGTPPGTEPPPPPDKLAAAAPWLLAGAAVAILFLITQ